MSQRLLYWSLTSALAGFLFGFDTVVISGAEQTIQKLWSLSDYQHGLAMGAALWGTVLGSVLGGWPTDRWGRTKTLFWIGILYLISAVWSGIAVGLPSFFIARFIGGVGVGISTVAAPLYIAEISPAESRGRLAGLFQFNIVFGILVAFLSNYLIGRFGSASGWRWMLGIEAVPALLYTLLCLGLPESPRWLIARRGDVVQGERVLRMISPGVSNERIQATIREIIGDRTANATFGTAELKGAESKIKADSFWNWRLRIPIAIAFLVAFFNQLSGINAILYFAPRIFALSGLGEESAMLQSVMIGITNLIFTFVGIWLIDRLGRRSLLYIGSWGYIVSLGLCSFAFSTESYSIVPLSIFAFIASHAIGQGAVIWVLIAEIFPTHHRAAGQALGSFTHWMFAAMLTTFFPKMVTAFPPASVFAFFCGMMVLQLIWVKLMVIETKGVPLEQIEQRLCMK